MCLNMHKYIMDLIYSLAWVLSINPIDSNSFEYNIAYGI